MLAQRLFFIAHLLWQAIDWLTPKRPDYWAFATHHLHTDRFIENQRALFEHVKSDPAIRKIIFYRGPQPDLRLEGAVNHEAVRHGSWRGLALLARCKVVFLTHSIAMDYSIRWKNGAFSVFKLALKSRCVVNLWHGIPLKRLLYAANEEAFRHTDRVPYRTVERRGYAGLIASSDVDSYAMSAMFYPLHYRQVWVTGLPRNDFLSQAEDALPTYVKASLDGIRALSKGRRVVLYAPTYRQTGLSRSAGYYQFCEAEIARLREVLERHNAVLAYRPHYFRNGTTGFNLHEYIDKRLIFDASQEVIPEFSALARELDVLVTDYSSVYIEALYLNKPVICFGYDIDHYRAQEDGLLYDMQLAFPGPVVRQFEDLLKAIEAALQMSPSQVREEQKVARRLFFRFEDGQNCRRVVQRVRHHINHPNS